MHSCHVHDTLVDDYLVEDYATLAKTNKDAR